MPDWLVPVAALLGIIVGALLKGVVDVILEERRERARERAALRLLGQDLFRVRVTMLASVERKEWWPASWNPTWGVWDAHRELLGARLASKDWVAIASAFFTIRDVAAHVETLETAPETGLPSFREQNDTAALERAIEILTEAHRVIERLLGEQVV